MQTTRKIIDIGGSQGLILPLYICDHLGIKTGEEVIVQDDEGKHGRFIAIWKKWYSTENYTERNRYSHSLTCHLNAGDQ